jgi:predicted DNA-binding transcriptional regulator AlpA
MDDMQPLLTKKQLAQLLQVSQRSVDRWFSENRLPSALRVEISGTVRYRPDIAQQWIADGCPQHQPEEQPMDDDRI